MFMVKFLKTLFDAEASHELTPNAIGLLTCIVAREDDSFYQRPVLLFNEHLQSLTGLTKHTLPSARDSAVNRGWLHYRPGGKGFAGVYWTIIPEWAARLSAAKRASNSLFRLPALHPENRDAKHDSGNLHPENRIHERETNRICHPENRDGTGICHPENRDHILTIPKTTPSPQTSWEEVEAGLSRIGLATATAITKDARAHGCTPELVLAVVRHYELHPGAWQSPGVVSIALLRHPATLSADATERWPPPSPEYAAARKRKHFELDSINEQQRQQRAREQKEETQIRAEENERRFGAELNSMDEQQMLRLCQAVRESDAVRQAFASATPLAAGIVRNTLLRRIREKTEKVSLQSVRAGPQAEPSAMREPCVRVPQDVIG
jgi:hypothetical protein